jgi:hypothetical protein
MKKRKKKLKVKGYSQSVRWDPELRLRQLRSTKMLEDCHAIMDEKKATRNAIKKRLLRRWKGTPLEVKTSSQMEKVYTRDVRLMQPHKTIVWHRPEIEGRTLSERFHFWIPSFTRDALYSQAAKKVLKKNFHRRIAFQS